MTLSAKQMIGVLAVLVAGVGVAYLDKEAATYIMSVMIVAVIAVVYSGIGAGQGPRLQALVEAARHAAAGDKPSVPSHSTGDTLRLYEALGSVAEQRQRDRDELKTRRDKIVEYERTLEEISQRLDANVQTQASAAEHT